MRVHEHHPLGNDAPVMPDEGQLAHPRGHVGAGKAATGSLLARTDDVRGIHVAAAEQHEGEWLAEIRSAAHLDLHMVARHGVDCHHAA